MLETTAPPWRLDPCPRPPLVLAGELALPAGVPCDAPTLVADVHVTRVPVAPTDRARAMALCSPAGHGVLVRQSAAWVWSGHPALLPRQVDLALPAGGPQVPGPRPGAGRRGLPLRATRWDGPRAWVLLGGVPLTDPEVTAADCARLLPEPVARVCVEALARSPGIDVTRVVTALRAGGARPGRRRALQLLTEQQEQQPRPPGQEQQEHEPPDQLGPRAPRPPQAPAGGTDAPPQSSATSRCTPLVTR
ncbi:hypothetical protein [Aquipuribacter sp. MA13-6]|uniref:hypothetical protein n=1 Tax=unclassified Aquipuribacter TaxID=2635084 RepID=UPI003EEE29FE